MASVSSIISDIRREYQALKQAFQASATRLDLSTSKLNFSTKENACVYQDAYGSFNYSENERVVVTLNCDSGANTLANLEITTDGLSLPVVRRIPYSGGARWIVSSAPNVDLTTYGWKTTNYQFTVNSMVKGTLSAKMIWE